MRSRLLELEQHDLEVLRPAALDPQLPARGGDRDRVRARLEVIGHDRVLGAAELCDAVDDQELGADAFDPCAHLGQEIA